MKNFIFVAIAVSGLILPAVSEAQLGGLLGGKSAAKSGPDVGAQQDTLVRNYMAAGKDVLNANVQLSEALGIKANAADAKATSDSISAKDVEAQDKAISADAAAVSAELKKGAQLKDDEAKAKYAKGLLSFATGVKKYLGLRKDAQDFASGMSSASPLQMGKLQAGAYVAKNLPTSISNLTDVLKNAVEFGKSNGVAIPADATSVL